MYDNKLKVTLSLIVDAESTIHPRKLNQKGLKALVVYCVADTLAQWDNEDVEVLESKLDE